MILRFCFLSAFLLTSSSPNALAKEQEHAAPLPACPRNTPAVHQKYHDYDKCNHAWQTSDALREVRSQRHEYLGNSGQYPLIPPQKTVVCPLEPVDLTPPTGVIGQDTRWIVENKASTPVVLVFVDNGVEKSAMNGRIQPPQADPDAILQPGQVKVVNTYEGHVFYVRELLQDGSTGDILLQHRPGIVEFTNRYGQELDCGDSASDYAKRDGDDENEIVESKPVSNSVASCSATDTCTTNDSGTSPTYTNKDDDTDQQISTSSPPVQQQAQGSASVAPKHPNQCNIIYQGFRNTLPDCPLDIYFAGAQQGMPSNGPMQCMEKKKFHLGTQPLNSTLPDESQLKFEVTYIGHSFVARLASNPNIVVDSFTVQPTEIYDCPRQKPQAVSVNQIVGETAIQHGAANLQNGTAALVGDDMEAIHAALACHENGMNDLSR